MYYYKILFYLIIIICLYLFNIYVKIDELNKISLKFFIDNYYILKDVEIGSSTILESVINFLKIPFKSNIFLDQIHEGSLYSNYIYKLYPELGIKMLDKIYWYNFFKENNIAHPEIIGYNRNNRIHIISKFNLSKEYICKPIIGTCGFNIKKVKGNQIMEILKNYKNTLIQELLVDCNVDTSRHFRFVTLFDGSKFILWLMKTKSKKIIASNHANGGSVKLCKNFLCNDLGYLEQQKIK